MSIIYILIPVAVLLTSLGIYIFFWAVKAEQFDDLEKQGMSILFDDERQHSVPAEQKSTDSLDNQSTEDSTKENTKEITEENTAASTDK